MKGNFWNQSIWHQRQIDRDALPARQASLPNPWVSLASDKPRAPWMVPMITAIPGPGLATELAPFMFVSA